MWRGIAAIACVWAGLANTGRACARPVPATDEAGPAVQIVEQREDGVVIAFAMNPTFAGEGDATRALPTLGSLVSGLDAQEALVRDLLLSTLLVLITVGAALLLYYRTFKAIPLLILARWHIAL